MKKVLSVVALFVMIGTFAPLSLSYSEGYTVIQLTDNSWADHDPRINDSNYVVWWGMGGTDYDIFLYDGTAITQLSQNEYDDWYPQINNKGCVVWAGLDGTDFEIYLYNGTAITQVTNNGYFDSFPQINNNGHIVWESYDGKDCEIYHYDGMTITQLTHQFDYDASSPQINDYGLIVWQAYDGTDYEIFLYDGTTITQLTDNEYDDWEPQINNTGYIVWTGTGDDGSDYEIFLYDGAAITQLTDNEYDDWEPQINDNGQVVWSAWNTGNEIYLYDGSAIAQFTDNDYRDREPHINNTGCMVWVGWVGYESIRAEIFMAEISLAPPVPDGVQIDIKPGSCLNPLNVKSKGVLPVAILGSEGFDVYEIDPTSVTLEGVSPIRYSYEDVATPAEDELGDCSNLGADGYDDLVLKFRVQDLDLVPEIAAVTVEDEKAISLSVTGDLRDGTPIGGADWVTVIK